jgi:hypothetical protein
MAYAYGPLMLHIDQCIFDTPLEERLQARTSDLVAGPRQCFQLSITALARLGHKFVPATTTSVLTSLPLVSRPPSQSFVTSRREIVRSNFLVTHPVTSPFSVAFSPEFVTRRLDRGSHSSGDSPSGIYLLFLIVFLLFLVY